jgi:ADP-ribosylglycohydrolase
MSALSASKTIAARSAGEVANLLERKRASLLGLYVADAIAMPVHWMYDLHQLKADYGTITGYVKPKDQFRNSIMNLSNTGGGGRGSDEKSIIGDVINHGKKKYWLRGGNFHYHVGLAAGENTLEAQLTRLLVRNMAQKDQGDFNPSSFLAEYVTFMRTPGSHNDTYASTAHRQFFENLVMNSMPPEQCAANDGHNTDSIDALTLTVPVIVRYAGDASVEREALYAKVLSLISLTRRSTALTPYAKAWTDLLCDVLQGTELRAAIEAIGFKYFGGSVKAMVRASEGKGDPMAACYIDSSFPAMLHFAYKYADSVEACLLANANAGGENVARGSLLGALMGAAKSMQGLQEPAWLLQGLHARAALEAEADALLEAATRGSSPAVAEL